MVGALAGVWEGVPPSEHERLSLTPINRAAPDFSRPPAHSRGAGPPPLAPAQAAGPWSAVLASHGGQSRLAHGGHQTLQ